MSYAEMQVASAFSFLRAASEAEDLAGTAALLGMPAMGIADRNSVAGVVRMHKAVRDIANDPDDPRDVRLCVGSWLSFADSTPDVLCYPTNRGDWGALTQLLSVGKLRAVKGDCVLHAADLAPMRGRHGPLMIVLAPEEIDNGFAQRLDDLAEAFPRRLYLAVTRRHRADDAVRLRCLADLGAARRIPLLATNDVRYHAPQRRLLHDALTAVRLRTTLAEAGLALEPHAERYLKAPEEMARLFAEYPQAIDNTLEAASRCRFSLDELRYQYPDEPVPPGMTADSHLARLAWRGAHRMFPNKVSDKVRNALTRELKLIRDMKFAHYFLTVNDIVQFARSKDILCQGRGSAANSTVCYCLGVTGVNPDENEMLFDRFISKERNEPPDIDVDFEHERREEVIQYIYERYGRHRAGLAATVVHYRPKMAIRDMGKVLGLPEPVCAALSAASWNAGDELWCDEHLRQCGVDPEDRAVRLAVMLARQLVNMPRHLSQHVGGFVLTRDRLDRLAPIGNGAMKDRTFIEWDKNDIDTLRLMKVDILALGMLTCLGKIYTMLAARGIPLPEIAKIPRDDPAVYAMLQRGDSIGVFQVESRAQINMLPRLKPKIFYDLVIEVAIVRPGPIQGDMVHPYLRRRSGLDSDDFLSEVPEDLRAELASILERTKGVPLFQEQAMSLAIIAAKFSPEEANALRRSMATFRSIDGVKNFHAKMVNGMVARGYPLAFAENCFRQIRGFGTYGFPESHAASFALLVYASAWIKCHHPAAFAAALLNSQPMGFYAPAQIVRDAREHGVVVRGADVNASTWDCTLDADGALRLGLRLIDGMRQDWADRLVQARGAGFQDFAALAACGLPRTALVVLAGGDALRGVGLDRRSGLWQARGASDGHALPLFAALPERQAQADLPLMTRAEQVVADYQTTRLSLRNHPLRFLRPVLAQDGVCSTAEAARVRNGRAVAVAGLVLVRQRPGSANGVVFTTIEDESGVTNVVIRPDLLETYRQPVLAAGLLLVHGRIHRSPEGVVHLVAASLHDRTDLLRLLSEDLARPVEGAAGRPLRAEDMPGPCSTGRKARPTLIEMHPRDVRVIPRSRDFH